MTQGQATWSLNNRLTITFLTFWFSVSRHPFSGWKIWSSEILSGFYLDLIRSSEPELVSQSDCKNQELESIIKHAFIAFPAMVPLSRCCIWPIFCSMTDAFCSSEKLNTWFYKKITKITVLENENCRYPKWPCPTFISSTVFRYRPFWELITIILTSTNSVTNLTVNSVRDNGYFDIHSF